jgi:hypothetical protein
LRGAFDDETFEIAQECDQLDPRRKLKRMIKPAANLMWLAAGRCGLGLSQSGATTLQLVRAMVGATQIPEVQKIN